VLFNFRALSVAAQAILWATIALVIAPMAERVLIPRQAEVPAPRDRDPVSV
jgi:hypothetical protein